MSSAMIRTTLGFPGSLADATPAAVKAKGIKARHGIKEGIRTFGFMGVMGARGVRVGAGWVPSRGGWG